MKTIKAIFGYVLAIFSLPLLLAGFMATDPLGMALVEATGLRISPWQDGGEVMITIDHGRYNTLIRETVFQALIGERKEGFVQIDWTPRGALPAILEEDIDYDGDGVVDFHIRVDTQAEQASLEAYGAEVLGVEGVYHPDARLSVRVNLKNQ